MKVTFDRTMEHLLHFNLYHWRHSPAMRKMYLWGFAGAPVSALIVAYVVRDKDPWVVAVASAVAAAVYCALLAGYTRWSLKWAVTRLMAEGHKTGILGRHELEMTSDGVRERSAYNESHHAWLSIERVVEDDQFIFIYTQPVAAYIVPKAAFENPARAEQFVQEAQAFQAAFPR